MKSKEKLKEKGITLIALVITIIILLILAAVTITALSGNNGILSNAVKAKEETEKSEIIEQIRVSIYGRMADNKGEDPTETDIEGIVGEYGIIDGTNFEDKVLTTNKGNYKIKLSDIWSLSNNTEEPIEPPSITLQPGEKATTEKNKYESDGKTARIPIDFTVSNKAGETSIDGGLVVYAPDGSEYVWIPVEGVLWDEGTSLKDVTENEKILLGRYEFKKNGTIDEDLTPTTLGGKIASTTSDASEYYTESTTGNGNAVATGDEGINSFIQSVRENHGYYIGRYEAGDAKATSERNSSSPDDNPVILKSGQYVYNCITQIQASNLCQNLYPGIVNSDLINSYAWDTAIVFIQQKGTENNSSRYSRQSGGLKTNKLALTGEGILLDTNKTDKQCNIYDMAGNIYEWTTENYSNADYPFVYRGGSYLNGTVYTIQSNNYQATTSGSSFSFRPILYF